MTGCGTALDERIDEDLLALNQKATALLPQFFEGVQMEQLGNMPVRFGEAWVSYLAAEIYGAADTALIAIVHNRGRQARILERQMYEMMIKAHYYIENEDDARLEYLALPFRDLEFQQQMQWDQQAPRYVEAANAVQKVAQQFPDVAVYVQKNTREKSVRQMVGESKDQDAIREYAFHYRRLSQTPHGAILGMFDVLDLRPDGNIGIRFDSRLDDPNFAIQNMTLYVITFLELVDEVFALGRGAEIEALKSESEATLARLWPDAYREEHPDEPMPR
ncbi:MAG TPA: DUF5677 domain-containing protein [Candidatus Elarobacter sp.]|jgi:hypothetical protein|nr:DUF5677 domain-containing protein [Candidatus Elarobacter sp.]